MLFHIDGLLLKPCKKLDDFPKRCKVLDVLGHLISNCYMLCCFSQISSRANKIKRVSRTNKIITIPKIYKKAISGDVGGM
jgi:hypothetical protein